MPRIFLYGPALTDIAPKDPVCYLRVWPLLNSHNFCKIVVLVNLSVLSQISDPLHNSHLDAFGVLRFKSSFLKRCLENQHWSKKLALIYDLGLLITVSLFE